MRNTVRFARALESTAHYDGDNTVDSPPVRASTAALTLANPKGWLPKTANVGDVISGTVIA